MINLRCFAFENDYYSYDFIDDLCFLYIVKKKSKLTITEFNNSFCLLIVHNVIHCFPFCQQNDILSALFCSLSAVVLKQHYPDKSDGVAFL